MDVCTLVAATLSTLLACAPQPVCRSSEDRQRVLCTSVTTQDCNYAAPVYQCQRPDGTSYALPASQAERGEKH